MQTSSIPFVARGKGTFVPFPRATKEIGDEVEKMLFFCESKQLFHFLVKGCQWFAKEMSNSGPLKITYTMWAPCFKLSPFELHGQKKKRRENNRNVLVVVVVVAVLAVVVVEEKHKKCGGGGGKTIEMRRWCWWW